MSIINAGFKMVELQDKITAWLYKCVQKSSENGKLIQWQKVAVAILRMQEAMCLELQMIYAITRAWQQ